MTKERLKEVWDWHYMWAYYWFGIKFYQKWGMPHKSHEYAMKMLAMEANPL